MSFSEPPNIAQAHRENLLQGVLDLIRERQLEAAKERGVTFRPDLSSAEAYLASLPAFRNKLRSLLGWPLGEKQTAEEPDYTEVAKDDLGRIFRVSSPGFGPMRGYGLLFLPNAADRYPLVIAQHGGQGTPELAAGMIEGGPRNYNRMITGLREHPVAIYAPQLLVWNQAQEPKNDQNLLDRKLRHCGGSRAALDLSLVQRAIDGLCLHPEIDGGRIGVCGLSYGGFYSLFLAALDERIKVAVSSCFINDRHAYDWEDFVWTDAARHFLDGEIARMICPRPLFLEAGKQDGLFLPEPATEIAEAVGATYEKLGIPDRFAFRVHEGGHEYDPDGKAQAFLLRHL